MADEHEATRALSIRIDEKLQDLSSSTISLEYSIFKVPNQLRQTNEKAYEPYVISIGPYHHGKDHLKGMEVQKMHYLKMLLDRRSEDSVATYVQALKDMEENIRRCYAEPLNHIDGEALVEMMLLDGCFVVEQICKVQFSQLREPNEFRNCYRLKRDLLLVENQLPFFVLLELFRMTHEPNRENDFISMALDFSSEMMPGPGIGHSLISSDQNIRTVLGLVHDNWLPSPEIVENYWNNSGGNGQLNFTDRRTATELKEAGVKFKKMDKDKETSLFYIKFDNGVLRIPTIRMEDNTESILRNLIAYEQCQDDTFPTYVTDYVTFMDYLINTGKDVEILRCSGVIDNWLGDDEVVAAILNRLGDSVVLLDEYFYAQISIKMRKYCDRKYNKWMANLRHDYFNTPWALISIFAAILLLMLTTVQSIFSVLSYYNKQ